MSIVSMLTASQRAQYLTDRQRLGFNTLWVNLLCASYTGCASDGRTADGVAPFTSGTSPATYNLDTPNGAFFAKYDKFLETAATYGMVVFLDPIETGGFLVTLQHNGPGKAYDYGLYIGNRYRNVPNIVWLHGNDYEANTPNDVLVGNVMAGIAHADTGHMQMIEIGSPAFRTNSDAYSNQATALVPYLGGDLVYTWAPAYNATLSAYNSTPTLPVFLGEGNYEHENLINMSAPADAYLLRETAYWTLTSGGAGYLYGSRDTWTSTWPAKVADFPGAGRMTKLKGLFNRLLRPLRLLDSPGARQVVHLRNLFNSIPWWNLIPDQAHQIVTNGYGTYTTGNSDPRANTYCSTAWTPDGAASVTYCPHSTTLTVALMKFTGDVTARWYDPATGVYKAVSGSPFRNSGTHKFTTPGNNGDGGPDWVLLLTSPPVSVDGKTRVGN